MRLIELYKQHNVIMLESYQTHQQNSFVVGVIIPLMSPCVDVTDEITTQQHT